METRPGEGSGVHVSRGQVEGIRGSLERHMQSRLAERLAQLADEDTETETEDRRELERLLETNVEGRFLDRLVQELCGACVVDEDGDGDEHEGGHAEARKVEPYDFALNDRLRTTYQHFEDLVQDTCQLRRDVPPLLGQAVQQRLAADVGLVHGLVAARTAATAAVLADTAETAETASCAAPATSGPVPLDNVLHTLLHVKTAVAQTVLSAETMARVARFE